MSLRRTLHSAVPWTATTLTVAVLTGCGATGGAPDAGQPSGDDQATERSKDAATSTPGPTRTPTTLKPSASTRNDAAQEANMPIEIRVGGERFAATVDDTPAGRDLLAQLPQTIEMRDHGGVEKTGPLQEPLSLDGQPDGADPDVGDLGYYAPGNDLVLYYGDQSYYTGIVILGRLDETAPSRLAAMAGDITATVTATDAS
jgi:hypothetical protein